MELSSYVHLLRWDMYGTELSNYFSPSPLSSAPRRFSEHMYTSQIGLSISCAPEMATSISRVDNYLLNTAISSGRSVSSKDASSRGDLPTKYLKYIHARQDG